MCHNEDMVGWVKIVRKFGVSWAIDQEISGHPIFQTSCHINWNLQIPPSCRCVDVCDLPI